MANFQVPERGIYSVNELKQFVISETYESIVSFVKLLNESVKGKPKSSSEYSVSKEIQALVGVMEELLSLVKEFPPIQQPMRFGNKAFRSWLERVKSESEAIHQRFLPENLHPAIKELTAYFCDSFGNQTRIDYGTGHETSFIVWLYGLHHIGFLKQQDLTASVLRVFDSYLKLMREMQILYMLEPAGSHGVWGLDDYQCLVFYFGSSQLRDQKTLNPGSIHDANVLKEYADEYLYFGAVDFIQQVKTGCPFAETSPMLNDISGVESWDKVNSGMLKLYEGEVLKKLPVIQHMVFGSILPCKWTVKAPTSTAPPNFDPCSTKAPWAIN